jgi:hypothetical protein
MKRLSFKENPFGGNTGCVVFECGNEYTADDYASYLREVGIALECEVNVWNDKVVIVSDNDDAIDDEWAEAIVDDIRRRFLSYGDINTAKDSAQLDGILEARKDSELQDEPDTLSWQLAQGGRL